VQLFKLEKLDKRIRHERIAEVSQEVKRLANELNLAIIEVAQFNRDGARSSRPSIHDLEGSGQLEKDASLCMLLDVGDEERTDSSGNKYREARIFLAKGRNVGTGEIGGRFYGRSLRFAFD
jgi:replicative DNA helicase